MAYELLNMGHTVLYQSAPSLFDILNEYKFKNYKDSNFDNILYSNIFNVELLIIDDLGTEFKSASRYADLLNVLNIRASRNSKKSICKTVISTNLNTKQLYEYYDERAASRIIGDFSIYRFFGEDLRKLKRQKNVLGKNILRSS
jgi:DNA replication protein DnaC